MYIVICETINEIWYAEFTTLKSAISYVKGYDSKYVCSRIFKCEEIEND